MAKAFTVPVQFCECELYPIRHVHVDDTSVIPEKEFWRAMGEFVDKSYPKSSRAFAVSPIEALPQGSFPDAPNESVIKQAIKDIEAVEQKAFSISGKVKTNG
jgi:hypothetical protein